MKTILHTTIACLAASICMAQTNVNIEISHLLNGNDMLTSQMGTNNLGEEFEATRLQYYLSQFSLTVDGGQTLEFDDFHALVNGLETTTINLGEIQASNIESLTFYVGVDPEHNHLDPSTYFIGQPLAPQNPSMHWGWAAGYRFVAFEGTAIATSQDFELHGLEDENYHSVTFPINTELTSNHVTINLLANCEKIVNDIELAQGPLAHGGYGMALVALENMTDYVFEYNGIALGVNEAFPGVSFNVFPNPTVDGLTQIIIDGMGNERVDLKVYDIVGKKVIEQNSISTGQKTELNLTKAGMYIVMIAKNGVTIATQKLVVQ